MLSVVVILCHGSVSSPCAAYIFKEREDLKRNTVLNCTETNGLIVLDLLCCKDQSELCCDLCSAATPKEIIDFHRWNNACTWLCLLIKG